MKNSSSSRVSILKIFETGFPLASQSSFIFWHVTALIEKLMDPSKYPGCSGTRNLHDNLSDLKAQVAANHKVHCINQIIS